MGRRAYGSGSVYQRSDGSWIGTHRTVGADGKRRSVSFVAASREEAGQRLDAWMLTRGLEVPEARRQVGNRAEHMARAQALGTHTAAQWRDAVRAAGGECAYCSRSFAGGVATKDHRTPVSRGGSDAIDNLAVCCMDCNAAKGQMTVVEFTAWAEGRRYFSGPRRRVDRIVEGRRRLVPAWAGATVEDGRQRCPTCGRVYAVNANGSLRLHRLRSDGPRCKGKGRVMR